MEVAGEKRVKTAFGGHEERSSSRMQRVEYTIPVLMLHWLLLFLLLSFLQQHGTEGALVGRRHRSLSSGGSNSSILPVAAAPGSSKFNGYYIRGQPVPLLESSRSTITLRLPGKSPERLGCEALGCASSQSNAVNSSSSSSKDPGDQVSSSRRSLLVCALGHCFAYLLPLLLVKRIRDIVRMPTTIPSPTTPVHECSLRFFPRLPAGFL
jgi:hypothetical protein